MRIAVIPGDGIGKEVTAEAVKVLQAVCAGVGQDASISSHLPWSADHYLATGETLPADGYRDAARRVRRDLGRRARRPARARQPPRPRHPARHPLRARPLRQLPAGASCSTIGSARSRIGARERRQLRRVSREHRRRLRRRRRALQGGHRRRSGDPGGDQHLQGRATASSATPSSSRRQRPDPGLHGRQEQRDAAGARAVAAGVQGRRRGVSRASPPRTCTSTRWRCSW